jgi:hypothetical protein
MKTEDDVRKMLKIIECFGHAEGAKALKWVLGEYPPPRNAESKPATIDAAKQKEGDQ